MALQKQKIQAPIVGGLDTKTDERNVAGTSFLELENWRFTKTGSLSKRNGFSKYPQSTQAGGTLTSGKAVSSFKDELLLFDGNQLYTYFEGKSEWIPKGLHENTLPVETAILNDGSTFSGVASAYAENISGFIMGGPSTSEFGVSQTVVIIDQINKEIISKFTFEGLSEAYSELAACAIGGKFFFFYKNGASDACYRFVDTADLTVISPEIVTTSATFISCIAAFNQVYFFLANPGFPGQVVIIDINGVAGSPVALPQAQYIIRGSTEGQFMRILYLNAASDLTSALYVPDMASQYHAPVVIDGVGTFLDYYAVQSATDTTVVFYDWNDNVNSNSRSIYRRPIYKEGNLGTKEISQFGAQLESGVYYDFDLAKFYFLLSKPYDGIFDSIFLASDDYTQATIISQFGNRAGVKKTNLSPALKIGESLFFTGILLAGVQETISSITSPTTVTFFEADFSQRFNYFDQQLGNNLHISGGILKNYDGYKIVEHGFLEQPSTGKTLSGAPTTAGADDVGTLVSSSGADDGLLTHGAYQVTYLYVYRDRFGQVYRSAPAVPWTVILDSGNANPSGSGRMKHYARTPSLTDKDIIEIEWYRTDVNGSILYKVTNTDTSFNSRSLVPRTNASSAFTIWPHVPSSYDVLTAAGGLLSKEIIYTEGGELETSPPAPSKMITAYKNRLFLLSSDGKSVYYSKEILPGSPAEFSSSLFIDLDSKGGAGISITSMDDYVVVFKESAIYVFGGEGPNSLGEQNDFRRPVEVNTDAGCIEPNSIVKIPGGVMFKSAKGIYAISRSLAVEYLGAPVEKFNSAAITSATLLETSNEVRFTTDANKILVYDYFHKYWTTFTPIQAVDAVNHLGTYIWIRADGKLYWESPNVFSDNGSFIKTRLRTAWIQFAGTQGYQRFYSLQILGAYKSSHKLRAQFAYDYDPALLQSVVVPVTTRMNLIAYGDENYGDGVYGGQPPLYQWEIRPKVQKCQAFQLVLEDVQDGTPGESMQLSSFALELGILPGTQRTPTAAKFGAS